jgi:hypothetical protein
VRLIRGYQQREAVNRSWQALSLGGSKLGEMNREVDAHFFDGIFPGGIVTEKRIESAGVRIIDLMRTGDTQAAKEAERILGDILILAIADGIARNPKGCASRYLTICQAALGELSVLDQIKQKLRAN